MKAPLVDGRDRHAVLAELLARASGYTRDWSAKPGTPGHSLAVIFARYIEILNQGLNQVPERSFLAFLSSIGVHLLPAQPARAPLVFTLIETSPLDVFLPVNSQVAAVSPPPAPSPLMPSSNGTSPQPPAEVLFSTTQAVTLTRSKLAALYSLDPGTDEVSDHSALAQSGFNLFDHRQPNEHALYIGHDTLFALAGEADVILSFAMAAGSPASTGLKLSIDWEYLSQDSWLPLETIDDRTHKLTQNGQIVLRKSCGPDAKQENVGSRTSYWVRGIVRTPLVQQRTNALPQIDTIQARVGFTKDGMNPEAAFTDAFQLDTANHFYPFGRQPERYTTFYIASTEAFQRRKARIKFIINFSEPGVPGSAEPLALAWQYFDGSTWQSLETGFDFRDGTVDLTQDGNISFICPLDWEPGKVNGQENYWLRVRINKGHYGHPLKLSVSSDANGSTVEAKESTLHPPVIASLEIQYTYQTESELPDHCLGFNDFVYQDHSHAVRWPRQPFSPFFPVQDAQPAVYFGFDQRLPSGLLSLYYHAEPLSGESDLQQPTYLWEYSSERGWTELSVLDETAGFTQSGMIQFIGPQDLLLSDGLDGTLYRIRARLKQGELLPAYTPGRIWINGVWGDQRQVIDKEVLGTSDGSPGQTYSFVRRSGPVLEGETVEVREWTGHGDHWQTAVQDVPAEDLRFEYDQVSRKPQAVWVRWHETPLFYGQGPGERCYMLERSIGLLRFSDGLNGMIPAAGSRISTTYHSGGGLAGNVAAGAVKELRTGVPYLMGASNPVPAAGGAATEELSAVRQRGPQQIRHRGRAVSTEDYAWLARQASPGVARARCLPLAGTNGGGQRGWVSLILVPHSQEGQPLASEDLKRRVRTALQAAAPAQVAAHIRILDPEYVAVRVIAEVAPAVPGEAAQVDALLRQRLNYFLHPLTGGLTGEGWAFGQPLYRSQIARLIEETNGVDYAAQIFLKVGEQMSGDYVTTTSNQMICSGDHELKLTLRKA